MYSDCSNFSFFACSTEIYSASPPIRLYSSSSSPSAILVGCTIDPSRVYSKTVLHCHPGLWLLSEWVDLCAMFFAFPPQLRPKPSQNPISFVYHPSALPLPRSGFRVRGYSRASLRLFPPLSPRTPYLVLSVPVPQHLHRTPAAMPPRVQQPVIVHRLSPQPSPSGTPAPARTTAHRMSRSCSQMAH